MIPYGKQWIDDSDINEVISVLRSDFITQGPKVEEFEKNLSDYCGAQYAVVFNSGTSALHGAFFGLGLKKGDEFITSPMTFVATSNAGLHLGATPNFVDIEADTGNLDVSRVEKCISDKTRLIVPVDYAGHPVNIGALRDIAHKHGLWLVEDACHALGAKYKANNSGPWMKVGNCQYSDMTVFSFHPVKHITTGEGGAVLTNRKEFYERLLTFRSHGITKNRSSFVNGDSSSTGDWYYEMQSLGYNYRMTDIQAALGVSQLRKLDMFVKVRREIADFYNTVFRNNPYFDIPVEEYYARSSYHLYAIRLKGAFRKRRAEVFAAMRKNGLGVQVHYIPVHYHPFYRNIGFLPGMFPFTEEFYEREMSLPIYPSMTGDHMQSVARMVLDVFHELAEK